MGFSAQDVIGIATKEIGTTENPYGSNQVKYASWANIPGQPWCAGFWSWCVNASYFGDRRAYGSCSYDHVYTPTGVDTFKAMGAWYGDWHKAEPGDAVYFNFGCGRPCHIELVVQNHGSYLETIGGNTSPDNGGSQSNGGGVYRRHRSADFVGVGRPDYGEGDFLMALSDKQQKQLAEDASNAAEFARGVKLFYKEYADANYNLDKTKMPGDLTGQEKAGFRLAKNVENPTA